MAKKKDSIIPILAAAGLGVAGLYILSQYGGTPADTGSGGWTGGTGTKSLTPIVTETTEITETIPIGGGEYPQIVLPAIEPYQEPEFPAWLFTPPAPTITAAPPPTATTTPTTKKTTVEAFGAGGGFGGGGAGGRGGDSGAVSLGGSWVGPITGITVYGPTGSKTYPVSIAGSTTAGAGGSGIPAEAIQSFFAAGKDYGAPAYSAPAPGGGTTYYYESGAYQTVKQGQIVSAGSAGSTTPPARYSGQYYAAPGTAAGGEKGRVYSKKAAQLAGLI